MKAAPPGLSIIKTRFKGPVRVIYGARQLALGRPVQLIGLAEGVLPSSPLARRLEREAEVLAQLDHPNICRLYDLVHDEHHLWLVLEDVDGPSLEDLVKLKPSWQAVAAIGLDLARALSHAHGEGHTHGKLRAEHVRLTRGGRTKLSGFGQHSALLDDEVEALEPTDVGGLSPEASIGQPTGPLSDLFCLGALLYELLSGSPPFGDPHENQYPTRVRNDQPRPLVQTRPNIPRRLELLIDRCLSKIPSERPESAADVAQLLAELIGSATLPLLHAELERFDLSDGKALPQPAAPKAAAVASPRRFPLWLLVSGLIGALLSWGLVSWRQHSEQAQPAQPVARALPDEEAMLLRVVATPWAHVLVDGKHLETTPFARPLLLEPGQHVVRLEHPHAPPEERTVNGRSGQAVLLNVQLHVKRPLSLEPELEQPEDTTP